MSDSSPISAEECTAFVRAMAGLQRALRVRLTPLLEQEHGIDLRLFVVLKQIAGGIAYPSGLALDASESPSQITRQLDKLERLGLIERALDRKDSRRIRLALTPAAEALFRSVEAAFAEQIGPALSKLEPDRRRVLIAGLQDLGEALQAGR
jgi:DNA-binding MarR family transcriptional regulator